MGDAECGVPPDVYQGLRETVEANRGPCPPEPYNPSWKWGTGAR